MSTARSFGSALVSISAPDFGILGFATSGVETRATPMHGR